VSWPAEDGRTDGWMDGLVTPTTRGRATSGRRRTTPTEPQRGKSADCSSTVGAYIHTYIHTLMHCVRACASEEMQACTYLDT